MVEYTTGTFASRARFASKTMSGIVAMQAGLGLQTAVLMSRISSALDLASIATGTGAGISGSVTPAADGTWAKLEAPVKT